MTETELHPPYAAAHPSPLVAEHSGSAVSWGAIIAGGVATAAFGLILLVLGTGLGLSSISAWMPQAENTERIGIAAIIWICVTQILTSGLGGYLAGRLRRRWTSLHVDETYFRDTAHGFLSWAIATLVIAALMGSVILGAAKSGAQAAAQNAPAVSGPVAGHRGDASAAMTAWPMGYFVDSLFRLPAGVAAPTNGPQTDLLAREEMTRIFLNSLASGDPLSPEDTGYAAQLVARHTGLSQDAAQARVTTTYQRLQQKLASIEAAAKESAERARKAAISAALWLFVGLLMGAFSSSVFATIGGRQRDL
jgi:hypothetical protein